MFNVEIVWGGGVEDGNGEKLESQGQGSLVGCHLWGRTESDTTEVTWQQQQQGLQDLRSPTRAQTQILSSESAGS